MGLQDIVQVKSECDPFSFFSSFCFSESSPFLLVLARQLEHIRRLLIDVVNGLCAGNKLQVSNN